MEASTEVQQIARGEQPAWEKTFEHPRLGELTFRVKRLPTVADWIAHTNAQAVLTGSTPSTLGAAVAAMQTFMEVPVLLEERVEDPENPAHEKIRKTFYDPLEDENFDWVCMVWLDFYVWREKLLTEAIQEQVKNSSGATSGADGDGTSPGSTDSPQPTPQ